MSDSAVNSKVPATNITSDDKFVAAAAKTASTQKPTSGSK